MLPTTLPEPAVLRAGTGEPALRWGVIAPGKIAGRFVTAMGRHTRQRLVAVASRTPARAEEFAAAHGAERAHPSYDALLGDPEIDVVYVAAPASEHLRLGLAAIAAGKHALIEKPLATNATDAQTLVDAARSADVLLMEAMWTRYLPQTAVIRTLLADGVLGQVRHVAADFGQHIAPDHRLFRADLGGGALLDLGIYPVQLASMVLGRPRRVVAVGEMSASGVDAHVSLLLPGKDGTLATLHTSLLAQTPVEAVIGGTHARIEIAGPFHTPTTFALVGNGWDAPRLEWRDTSGVVGNDGLSWEATALAHFVGQGRTESPLHDLDETVAVLATIDEARRQLTAG